MMIEPNLFLKDKTGNDYAKGFHDKEGKCFYLKAGSQFTFCGNSKKVFWYYPYIQKIMNEISSSNPSTTGDDNHFYLRDDIKCYAIADSPTGNNLDELSIAASIVYGKLMKGENVWKNEDGVSVKKMKSSTEPIFDDTNLNIQRYEAAAELTFNMIYPRRDLLIQILSYAYWFNESMGNKNEDLFMVPRQIDHSMRYFGFGCVEEAAYDLIIPGEYNYTISDKTNKEMFHHKISRKSRTDTIKGNIMMSNIRSGQSSDNITRPQFDCLLAMQYNPYLVCGVAPYNKIVRYFRIKDGGTILGKVPIENFRYIISPTEGVPPERIPLDDDDKINDFCKDAQGEFLPNLLRNRLLTKLLVSV